MYNKEIEELRSKAEYALYFFEETGDVFYAENAGRFIAKMLKIVSLDYGWSI